MKRPFFLVLALLTLVLHIGCGGGGGGGALSTSGSYRSNVQIVVGQTRTASHETGTLLKAKASNEIPSGVANIRFTISAPDMVTILRVIPVAGRTTITESFEVPVGPNRRFLVESLDSGGNVIFRGDIFADVGQQPLSLTVSMVNTDPNPPIFAGLTTITEISTTSLVLNWSPATDTVTPQSNIQYLVFMSTTSGGESLSTPTFTTGVGATSYSVTGLRPSTAYYFIVRAKDEIGNVDTNTREVSVVMPFIDLAVQNPVVSTGGAQLDFDIVNNGNYTASDITWSIEYPATFGAYPYTCQTHTISSLSPNAQVHFTFNIPPGSYYAIWVDPLNVIPEPNKDNNFYNPPGRFDHFSTILCDCFRNCAPVATTLSNPVYSLVGLNDWVDPAGGLNASTFNIGFTYSDINGDANKEAGASLQVTYQFSGSTVPDFTFDKTAVLSGINGYSGSVYWNTQIRFYDRDYVVMTFTLTDGGGNISNALQLNIPRPAGAN